jgi:anti-sigma factor RsiW
VAEIAAACRAFDEDLSALLDGELGAERRAELEAHVAGCPGCASRLEALRAVDRALAALPAPSVAPDLGVRLRRRLQHERFAGWHRARFRRVSRSALILPPAAAAAAGLVLYLVLSPPGEVDGPVAPVPVAKAPAAPVPVAKAPAAPVPVAKAPAAPVREPARREAEAPAPEPQVARQVEPAPVEAELESLDTEALAVVLELETIEDLPVIANLEVLERLLREEAG